MNSPSAPARADRQSQVDYVARELIPTTSLLTRLIAKQLGAELSRTDAGVLNTLSRGPRRITELAQLEGLAQPTMTLLIKQLEQRGLVRRARDADDGRAVLISIADAGAAMIEDLRVRFAAALGPHLEELSDDQLAALRASTEALGTLVDLLQRSDRRFPFDSN
jgi:DNA-binding MarR family transcriptional regulator